MTKIKSIELEMTQEEKETADKIWAKGDCRSNRCSDCPFSIDNDNNLCLFKAKELTENFVVKVIQPKLKLYEDMPIINLMFRNLPDLRIVDIYETKDKDYPITVIVRDLRIEQIFTIKVTTVGKYLRTKDLSDWDIVWKEEGVK